MPFSGAVADNAVAFGVTNTGDSIAIFADSKGPGSAVNAIAEGTGIAGFFQITNPNSDASALVVTTNGSGRGGSFTHTGTTGHAGYFMNINTNTSDASLFVDTNGAGVGALEVTNSGGVGYGGLFVIDDPDFIGAALLAQKEADGPAIEGVSAGSGPYCGLMFRYKCRSHWIVKPVPGRIQGTFHLDY